MAKTGSFINDHGVRTRVCASHVTCHAATTPMLWLRNKANFIGHMTLSWHGAVVCGGWQLGFVCMRGRSDVTNVRADQYASRATCCSVWFGVCECECHACFNDSVLISSLFKLIWSSSQQRGPFQSLALGLTQLLGNNARDWLAAMEIKSEMSARVRFFH